MTTIAIPATSAATPTPATGEIVESLHGVPTPLTRGTTIDLGYAFQNASNVHACIADVSLFIGRYFTDHGIGYAPVEMPVSFQDPTSKTWVSGSWPAGGGNVAQASWPNGACPTLNPGQSLTIQIRVTIPTNAPTGKYELYTNATLSLDNQVYIQDTPRIDTTIGSTPSSSPHPTPTQPTTPKQAPPAPTPSPQPPTTTPTTTPPPPTSTSPTLSSTTEPTPPAPTTQQPLSDVAPATTPTAATGNSGTATIAIAVAAIAAAITTGTVLSRRRRASATADPAESTEAPD